MQFQCFTKLYPSESRNGAQAKHNFLRRHRNFYKYSTENWFNTERIRIVVYPRKKPQALIKWVAKISPLSAQCAWLELDIIWMYLLNSKTLCVGFILRLGKNKNGHLQVLQISESFKCTIFDFRDVVLREDSEMPKKCALKWKWKLY